MAKTKDSKNPQNSEAVATEAAPGEANATAVPQDVTVPVEATATAAAAPDGKKAKPAKEGIPEHLKKGNRVCASCGTPEADFLAKNPRYSLCQGVDVLCYRKGDRVIYGQTLEQVKEKYPEKVGKTTPDGNRNLIEPVGGVGIKEGILVRGAIKYSRSSKDTATGASAGTPTPAETATTATPISTAAEPAGSVGTTSAG